MTIFIMSVCLSVCRHHRLLTCIGLLFMMQQSLAIWSGAYGLDPSGRLTGLKWGTKTFVNTAKAALLFPALLCWRRSLCLKVTSHLGDKPSRRQSSRRQTNSATLVGLLGDNLFRLSVQELATLLNCHVPPFFIWGPLDSVQLFSAFTTQY